jgi:hypothetical protein
MMVRQPATVFCMLTILVIFLWRRRMRFTKTRLQHYRHALDVIICMVNTASASRRRCLHHLSCVYTVGR